MVERVHETDAGWVQGLLVSSAGCMVVISGAAVLPIIPSMLHAFKGRPGSDMLVQLSVVAPLLAIAVTGPIAGVLGERIGRRALLNICMLAFAVFGIAPFWLADLRLVLASRALMGVAASGMVTSAVGLTGDYYTGVARQRWLAIQGAAAALSSVVSSAASGALAEMNWRLPFLMMAAGFPVFLALLCFAGPPASAAAGDAEEVATGAPGDVHLPRLIAVFALGVAVSIMFWPPAYGFGLLLEEKALGSAMLTGLTTSISAAGAAAGSMSVGLLKGVSLPLKQAAAFAVAGAGMVAIWVSHDVPLLMAGAIAVGVAQGATGPILSGWLLEETPFRLRGRTVGLYQTTFFLAQFASPLLARIVATSVGSTTSSMVWYAAACVLPIIAIAGFRTAHRASLPRACCQRPLTCHARDAPPPKESFVMITVLVTGANRGLGLELTRQYADDGAQVIACCRVPSKAEALNAVAARHQGRVDVLALDVADAAQIETLKGKLGGRPVDILINNAGIFGPSDFDAEGWMETFRINALAPVLVAQALRDNLLCGEEKKLVAITSYLGSTTYSDGGYNAYRVSKVALNNAMPDPVERLGEDGILVAILNPGWVKTDMGGEEAPIAPAESIRGLRARIAEMTAANSGAYRDYTGAEMPW